MSTPNFRSVGEHVQRIYSDKWELAVDDLLKSLRAERFAIERHQVINAFQHFEKLSLGQFVVGRRGKPSRMVWRSLPKTLEFGNGAPDKDAVARTVEMLEYPLMLRSDVTARLILPADLSNAESVRIADFIQRLPLSTQ